MSTFAGWWTRLRRTINRRAFERQMVEEMRAHLELETAQRVGRGEAVDAARRRAALKFGHVESYQEQVRDRRWGGWLEQVAQDVRYATRLLRKSPGFTIVAVVTLALSIGASTSIYSALDAALLRPLPYPQEERLVSIWETTPRWGINHASGGAFRDWREHSTLLHSIVLLGSTSANLRTDRGAEHLQGGEVTSGFLDVFGIAPLRGRGFRPEDEIVGGTNNVVMLTEECWRTRFAADESLVGRTIVLDEVPREVIGILPAGTVTDAEDEFFVPAVLNPNDRSRYERGGNHWAIVLGRLQAGATPAQLDAELKTLKHRLNPEYPDYKREWGVQVVPLREFLLGTNKNDSRPALFILAGAVGLVLLIACANVANLLLARSRYREREIALRAALGASGSRLGRQVLTESLLLAGLGGLLGVILSIVGIRLVTTLTNELLPDNMAPQLDVRVLAAAVVITCGTGLLFGLLPAWRSRRPDLNVALKNGDNAGSAGGRTRSQSILVVAEVALTVVLLATAGLFLRSLANLTGKDPGYVTANTLTFDLTLPDSAYQTASSRLAFIDQILERLGAIPGVETTGFSSASPLGGGVSGNYVSREERTETRTDLVGGVVYVRGDYFEAMGARLLRGRFLTTADERRNVAVIDERLARTLFPEENPLGALINSSGGTWEVVGVVANMNIDPNPREAGGLFLPQMESPFRISIVVRAAVPPATLQAEIRRAVAAVDAGVPLANVRTLREALNSSFATRRMMLQLIGGFAAAALALACLGLYGVMAYTVATRRRELSIRMALGALGGDVIRLVLRDGLRLTMFGLIIGLAGALAVGQVLESQLFEVSRSDPAVLAATTIVIASVTLLACWLPAWRAARLNPIAALRND